MGFIPQRLGYIRRVQEQVAELLETKKCLIHGQLVDVHVYGPGSSGRVRWKTGPEMIAADRIAREAEKKDYHPQHELAYIGVPNSPAADVRPGGEATKGKSK